MATIRLKHITKTYSLYDQKQYAKAIRRRNLTRKQDPKLLSTMEIPPLDNAQSKNGSFNAIDDLSLTIPDGKTLSIVGPSGCGKSTLLRIVGGLIDYEGDVFYDDVNVNAIPVKERAIGMVFQNFALYPHFYGKGNVIFSLKMRKALSAEIEERVQTTAEVMGIGFKELLRRKPGTLSGGQQQRVAIARAITRDLELFLLDEPLSNLDAKLRTQTRIGLHKLLNHFRITAVYVTHDQVEAITLGDSIAVMRAGRIVQMGPYRELFHNPANAFVAGFLGLPPMNLLSGTVTDGRLTFSGFSIPLPNTVAHHTHTGQTVTLGFHSNAAVVASDDQTQPVAHFRGQVAMLDPDFGGQRQIAFVRCGDQTLRVEVAQDVNITRDQNIDIVLPLDSLYFFDTESEGRIF